MDGVIWMLVSPDNRPLGRCEKPYETYGACREAVLRLREQCDRLKSLAFAVEEISVLRVAAAAATVALLVTTGPAALLLAGLILGPPLLAHAMRSATGQCRGCCWCWWRWWRRLWSSS